MYIPKIQIAKVTLSARSQWKLHRFAFHRIATKRIWIPEQSDSFRVQFVWHDNDKSEEVGIVI